VNLFGGRSVAEVLLLIKVGVSAVAGGLLGMSAVLHLSTDSRRGLPLLLLALVLAVSVLSVVAVAAMWPADDQRALPGPPPHPWPGPPPMTPPQPQGVGAFPPPPPTGPQWYDHAAQQSAALRTLPAPGATQAARAPAALPPVEPEVDRRPAVLDEHRVPGARGLRRRIVQCPRCADFEIAVWEQHDGFAFGCQACQHQWRWIPGSPWPPTVVRPALARRRPPTRPA
jgi:hypothetical protein